MKRIINIEELGGSVVREVTFTNNDNQVVITFENDTYLILRSTGYYGNQEIEFGDVEDLEDYELVKCGLMTQEEFDKKEKQRKLELQRSREEVEKKKEKYDRQEYERLKKKFGE